MKDLRCNFALLAISGILLFSGAAQAAKTTFFNATQSVTTVASATTSETIGSQGYLFTYTVDKLFTGGLPTANPVGRPVVVTWPAGIQAQSITSSQPRSASITITRQDGGVFDITSFTTQLLASTASAGATIEIVPSLRGQPAASGPLMLDMTGNYNNIFTFAPTGLSGYDTYTFSLYADFAMTGLTVVDASVASIPEPETYSLILAGLGMIGIAARRRRYA